KRQFLHYILVSSSLYRNLYLYNLAAYLQVKLSLIFDCLKRTTFYLMANWPVVQLYEFDYFVHSNFLMHLVLLTGKGLLPDFLVYLIFLNVITLPPEKYLVYYLSGDLTILMISRAIQNQAKITCSLAHLHVSNLYCPKLALQIDYYL